MFSQRKTVESMNVFNFDLIGRNPDLIGRNSDLIGRNSDLIGRNSDLIERNVVKVSMPEKKLA